MGRAKKEISPQQVRQIERLAAIMPMYQICDFFGISEQTLRRRMMEDPEIKAAYARGRATAHAELGGTLLDRARGGCTKSLEFYLRTQAGWSEKSHVDITTDGKALPAAQVNVGTDEILRRIKLFEKQLNDDDGGS
jgi:hypothetical protein